MDCPGGWLVGLGRDMRRGGQSRRKSCWRILCGREGKIEEVWME